MNDEEFRRELESHLAHEADQLAAEGIPRPAAEALARRTFGNVTQTRERFYETRHWIWLEQLRQDLQYAVRLLGQSPMFTAIAILSLALGVGANTALFSVVNTLLFKMLPYSKSERLVYVSEYWPREPAVPGPPSPDFENWRANSRLIDGIAAYGGGADALNLVGAGEPERIRGTMVTAGLLEVIGVRLALGRNFTAEEDQLGGPPAMILGYGLWQRRFGAAPDVIGKAVRLNGVSRTIVGVLPSGFAFPDNNFPGELLVPMALPTNQGWRDDRNFRLLRVLARLKPGVAPSALRDEFASLLRGNASQEPPQMVTMRRGMEVRVVPLREWLTGGVRRMLIVLQATVALLLLIACLNIASLQVARVASRQKEMALRAAVGASRGRLLRQLLTESVLLGSIGGALGFVLGYAALNPLRAFLPANLHLAKGIAIDTRVLWFTLAIAFLTGILTGVVPALIASRPQLQQAMKEGGLKTRASQRLHGALVMAEIAAAMILLVGSAMFFRTFIRLASIDPGFRPDNVLTMRISLPQNLYPERSHWLAFFTQLLDRVRALPGVEFAAVGGGLPLLGTRGSAGMSLEGDPPAPPGGRPTIPVAGVSSDYFRALGIPVRRGRPFSEADRNGPDVVIVNQAFVQQYFLGQDPLGKRLEFASRQQFWREVVGVAGDVKQQGRRPIDPFIIYAPLSQLAEPEAYLILKTQVPPESLTGPATAAVHALDRNQPVYDIATMEERLGASLSAQRANMTLMGVFAILALLLATIGMFGVIAYFVSRRAREIGIRIAVGASRGNILRMVLGRGMKLAAAGIAVGLMGAFAVTRSIGALLEGVQTNDPAAFSSAAIVFALVAVVACIIPARSASRVDPMVTLRSE
jgi:putative ABC transport system permease protein